MNELFFITIIINIFEGIFQYNWSSWYFQKGIPIFFEKITQDVPNNKAYNKVISFKKISATLFLVRQMKYGWSRYAFYHGQVKSLSDSSTDFYCTLYIDLNAIFCGAFLGGVIISGIGGMVVGALTTYLMCYLNLKSRKKHIIHECFLTISEK